MIFCQAKSESNIDFYDKVVEAAVRSLMSLSVSDADVKRAKNQLKAQLLQETETGSGLTEALGLEAVLRGSVAPISQVLFLVDGVTTSDVSAVSIASSFTINYIYMFLLHSSGYN